MKRTLAWALAASLAVGCGRSGAKASDVEHAGGAPDHTDEKEHEGLPKRVRLPAGVVDAAGIRTQGVQKTALPSAVELPGEIAADPDRTAQVAARMPGRLESVAFQEGSLVKAGDVLAVVRAPQAGELSSASQSLAARAAAARSNATRLAALLKSGLASQQEVVAADSEADSLEAEARAARERAGAIGAGAGASISLRAPITGVVISRNAVVGQPVTGDETIATIVDLSEAWFLARVFEQTLARVRVGATAEVWLNAFPDEPLMGTVDYVAERVDPSARTVVARVRLENHADMLRVGLFGTARIDTGEASQRPPAIVVPRTAIAEIGGKHFVFVRQADGDFELHEVVLGEAALGRVEVIAGLREGENLVTEGVFTLKSAVLRASLADEEE